MRTKRTNLSTVVVALAATTAACAVAPSGGFGEDTGSDAGAAAEGGARVDSGAPVSDAGSGGTLAGDGAVAPTGCPKGVHTTISGTVFDPAGKNPLYDVVAYVPKSTPDPIVDHATCDTCAALYTGGPIAAALSGPDGKFVISDAPDGVNVPVVIQIGKWRKQVVVPKVTRCSDTTLPKDMTTLPSKHGPGSDMPKIAMVTGGADSLECLLRRVGIDDSEFTPGPAGDQRVHIYQGEDENEDHTAPTMPPFSPADFTLWDSAQTLLAYDAVIMSCEGSEISDNKPPSALQALQQYLDQGGRVIASHFHYYWFENNPTFAPTASWTPGANHLGSILGTINTSFPKGASFAAWLGNVGALANGLIPINEATHNADDSTSNPLSEPWIFAAGSGTLTQFLTFNTPIGAPPSVQCGRAVYTDLHVGGAAGDYGGQPMGGIFPSGCQSGDLSPQEKALEFMLFDVSSCVIPDGQPPQPPPTAQ